MPGRESGNGTVRGDIGGGVWLRRLGFGESGGVAAPALDRDGDRGESGGDGVFDVLRPGSGIVVGSSVGETSKGVLKPSLALLPLWTEDSLLVALRRSGRGISGVAFSLLSSRAAAVGVFSLAAVSVPTVPTGDGSDLDGTSMLSFESSFVLGCLPRLRRGNGGGTVTFSGSGGARLFVVDPSGIFGGVTGESSFSES